MNPLVMSLLLVGLWGAFFVQRDEEAQATRAPGSPTWEPRTDRVGERLLALWTFAFWQKKMRYYWLAGIAHQLIFVGFVVLLLRTLVLWGRGFDPGFNLWILGPEPVARRAARRHLRLHQGRVRAARDHRRAGVRLLPRRSARKAHDAERRGAGDPRHHHHA